MNVTPFTTEPYRPPRSPLDPKTAAEFCSEYVPLSYAIEPLVRSRSLYTLTAKTGAGKTALMVAMALSVAAGRSDILGTEVERGRVAYLAFENPDDVRMRMMIAAYLLNVSLRDLCDTLVVIDVRMKPEDVVAKLAALSKQESFSLILGDTVAAWFDGKDINDNVQAGEFMRRVRPLTNIGGNPSVIVAAHPVKGAGEENLVPYGGGAILNEVDGNLTLWKRPESGSVTLHWQGKLRGLEFAPVQFRFDITGSPDILDAKGRQVQLPTLRPSSDEIVESREDDDVRRREALLRAIANEPGRSVRGYAEVLGCSKSAVDRHLLGLLREKLAERVLDKWTVTTKGKKALE